MPSKKGEGIHRVIFPSNLTCGCTINYPIRPSVDDYVWCRNHDAPAKILKVSRLDLLTPLTA